MIRCPCQGCEAPERTTTCHFSDQCEKHKAWKAEQEELNHRKRLVREAENTQSERAVRIIWRSFKNRRK